ncbi:class I SAM-dependent methyltransferase [Clostridium merdae]|uniref:class I SAM-dependent methyltransferase n=1 Tax=Clostridium merdae TaxID=1958780 RepID=UPI000A27061D|nr:class I SAM-dependent methyltransferase [Clostridium merdae]
MKDTANQRFWERMAKLYAPFMKSSESLYQDICSHCQPYLKKDMDVLELACGSGQFSFPLAANVQTWIATDFSSNMVSQAKKQSAPSNLTFEVQDATSLPYPDEHFHAVFIANALHIMPEPEKAMEEIHRVLKPDGTLLAPTFLWNESRQTLGSWLVSKAGLTVYRKWNAQEFERFIESHDFRVVERKILGGGLRPLSCMIAIKNQNITDTSRN